MQRPVVIIGSGPAGLAAAGILKVHARLLEQHPRACGKILIAGSGQCNFTHDGSAEEFLQHYGHAGRWLKPSLYAHPNTLFREILVTHGTESFTRDDGKVFPISLNARDVLNALLAEAAGVEILTDTPVQTIEPTPNGFCIITPNREFDAAKVILAGGGKAALGRQANTLFELSAALGHTLVSLHPALAPIHTQPHPLSDLSGISCDAALLRPGKKRAVAPVGPLLVTHFGFSGPLILDHARDLRDDTEIAFDLLPNDVGLLADTLMKPGKRRVLTLLTEHGLQKRLATRLLELARIDTERTPTDFPRGERERLLTLVHSFPAHIQRVGDFSEAMCTAGGIALDEVNSRTLESRICPGVYFAGEMLDYDGDSGGYNIQAAWSTGRCAGLHAAAALDLH